jgi:uncharacterized membrane protein YdjX (TVP38/TMEM64 family)
MKKYWKQILFLAFLAVTAVLLVWLKNTDFLTFENLKEHRELLKNYVHDHYVPAAFGFIFIYLSTAFIIPGAIILTLAGGFLFGTVPGALYVNIGATTGAAIAFLLSRYLIGEWIQQKYENQLRTFNEEISRHGHNYLLTLRVIPILPFFVINYLAGLTEISLKKFIWTTSLGMLPGSLLYAFAGQQLATIDSVKDILSTKLVLSFVLLGVLALSPVVVHRIKKIKRR